MRETHEAGMTAEQKPCNCKITTNIADEISCGTGDLDFNGFWEFPCTHGLAEYFERKLAASRLED